MKPNPQRSNLVRRLLAPVFALGLLSQAHAASLLINVATTNLGSTYQYDFTISNTGSTDIPIVSIGDAPIGEPLIGSTLTTPAGFAGSYDGGLGKIDFLGNTQSFTAGSTFSGFSFQSAAAPGTAFTSFSAFDNNGTPATVTVVPEASASILAMAGLVALAAKRRR